MHTSPHVLALLSTRSESHNPIASRTVLIAAVSLNLLLLSANATAQVTSGQDFDFGMVEVHSPKVKNCRVDAAPSNMANLDIVAVSLSGANVGDFAISQDACSGRSLAPGQNCLFDVIFTPTGAGVRTAVLTVVSSNATPTVHALHGIGTEPHLTPVPANLDFGGQAVDVNMVLTKQLVIISDGSASAMIQGITLAGADQTDFGFMASCPSSLSPGQKCSLSVEFRPSAVGIRNASLIVDSNAGTLTIPLSGSGLSGGTTTSGTTTSGTTTSGGGGSVELHNLTASPGNLNFGSQTIDIAITKQVLLTSAGNADISIASTTVSGGDPGDFNVISDSCSGSIAPGHNCYLSVAFRPSAVGLRSANLVVVSNNDSGPLSIPLVGTGADIGDVNLDGRVDIADAELSLQAAIGSILPQGTSFMTWDVNRDGKLDLKDTLLILMKALGI